MLNKCILMGRLTQDPELRHTTTGNVPVATFRIAVNRNHARRDDQQQADFIDIVTWRERAEFVSKYFTKGMMVAVSGSLQMRNWKDKDGNNRTTYEVVAEEVHFAESKRSSDGGGTYRPSTADRTPPPGGGYKSPATDNAADSDFEEINGDDELPF